MSISRRWLYISVSIVILAFVGAFVAGCTCAPGAGRRMPPACQYWYEKGQDKGYDEGYEAGEEDGYDEGKDRGYDEGKQAGYQEGYNKGLVDGRNQCPECEDREVPYPYPVPDAGSYQRGYNDALNACRSEYWSKCVSHCNCDCSTCGGANDCQVGTPMPAGW